MKVIPPATTMTALICTLFIFSNPVAGVGGWYIDEDTCEPTAREFLQSQFSRSAIGHANLATAFGALANRMSEEVQQLVLHIMGGPDPPNVNDAIVAARVLFRGGPDPTRQGAPYIRGLESLNTNVSQLTTTTNPNGLKAYCKASRLGRAMMNGQPVTYDGESHTFYQRELPPCGRGWEDGSAIVLTHFAERNAGQTSYEPDRVTFCEWFIDHMVDQYIYGGIVWDTSISIRDLRTHVTEYQDGNGDVDRDGWRDWRNGFMPQGAYLPDVDMSIGFDTWLTSVLAHTSAGGFKGISQGVGQELIQPGQVFVSEVLPPTDSWGMNAAWPKVGLAFVDSFAVARQGLPYMLLDSVINNYIVGFTIDMISGNYINPLSEWYPNCEFMTNYIPFETAGAGCADEESD